MANIKISGLYNIGTGIADEDLFVVVDNSALTSNSMSWANIIALANTHIQAKIDTLIDSAPDALNTLNELAAALGDDENFASSITVSLGNVASNTIALQGGIEGTNSLVSSSNTAVVSAFQANDYITFTRLDANINLVQDNVASLTATVDTKDSVANVYSTYLTLSGGLTGANTNISSNDTDILNLITGLGGSNTRISAEEANVIALQGGLAGANTALSNEIAATDIDITNLVTGLGGSNTRIAAEEANVIALQSGISGSNSRISAEEANVIALQGGLTGANTAIASNDTDILNLVTGLGGSNTLITALEARRNANTLIFEGAFTGSNTRIAAEEANVIALQGGIEGANTTISTLDTVANVYATYTRLDSNINVVQDNVASLVTGLDGSNTNITALEARRAANTSIFLGAHSGANTRITAEEANVIALQGGIAGANSAISGNDTDILNLVTGLEGSNVTIATKDSVANVYATYLVAKGGIDGANTAISSNDTDILNLVTGLGGSNTLITALEARRAANTAILLGAHSGANSRIAAEEANVIALQGGISGANTAIGLRATTDSPTFTGIPAAPTAAAGTSTTQIATTAFVGTAVANIVDSAPEALNTLNELAAALGDDANFSATVSTQIGTISSNTVTNATNITAVEARRVANIAGAVSSITTSDLTASRALASDVSGKVAVSAVTSTELGYLTGVTSAIQTQLDGKQASGSYLTGNQTITLSGDVSGSGTTAITVTIADDSHNHVISNIDNLQTSLDAKDTVANVYSTYLVAKGGIDAANTNITALEARRTANIAGAISSVLTSDLTASRALQSGSGGKIEASAVTSTELGYLSGVTSAVQTQLDGKQASGSYLTGNQTITLSGDVSGSGTTAITVTIADDSHNHIISNIDNLQTTLDAKDTVANVYSTYLTLLGGLTGANSAISTNESTRSSNAAELAAGIVSAGGTMTAAEIRALGFFDTSNDGAGSGLDADLLDGISSASFLRSDTSDSITSGSLTLDAGNITINNGTNLQINLQASDGAIEITRAAGGAYIDFKNTTAEDYDARLQESGGSINLNGNRILTIADEGSGNGLDADTLDGVEGASYLRSDASDTYTGQLDITSGQNIRFGHANQSDANDGKIGAGLFTSGLNIVGTQTVAAAGRRISIYGTMYDGSSSNKYWHAGIDGAGSGLDADTLDGVEGASYLRSDTSDTFTGTLTVSGDITTTGDIYLGGGQVHVASGNLRTKYSMWGDNDATYGIGMFSAFTYGGLNDYAMTFQMNDDVDRGFWWGDNIHTAAQGAMSLTTIGELTVAKSISIAGSESVTSATTGLYMYDDGNPHVHGDNNLWINSTSGNLYLNNQYSGNIIMTNGTGKVGIGTSNTPSNKDTVTPKLVVNGSGVAGAMQVVRNTTVGAGGAILELTATRGSDVNSYTILQNGDGVGSVVFGGADGNEFVVAGSIVCQVDGTPGDNDMPGRLVFNTTADGASSPTERMRITSSGSVGVGTTSPSGEFDVTADKAGAVTHSYVRNPNATGGASFVASSQSDAHKSILGITDAGGGGRVGTITNDDFYFVTNNLERMRISSSGNVGIGTSSPTTKLHITSAGSTYTHPADNDLPTLYLYNTNNTSTNAHAILTLRTAGSAGGDPFVSFDIAGEAGWALGVDNSDSNKFKISSAWTNVATNTELTLDNSGNLSVVGKLQESGSNLIPAGFIGMWGAAAAPSGWYLCEGDAISRTTYSALFAAIGTTYGAGDGSTTFNVPDFRDRAPYGASTYLIGSKTASEIDVSGQLASASGGPTTHSVTTSTTNSTTDKDVTNSITVVTAVNAHSTHTHTITYPAVAVKFIIKT
jgi:microcystin-dependent protein